MTEEELLHPSAVYIDIRGHRHEIRAENLKDQTILNDALGYAKEGKLYDWSGAAKLHVNPGIKD